MKLSQGTDNNFKYLILGVLIIMIFISLREFVLKPKEIEVPSLVLTQTPEIKINIEKLKDKIDELVIFELLEEPEEYGRDYPFEQYSEQDFRVVEKESDL